MLDFRLNVVQQLRLVAVSNRVRTTQYIEMHIVLMHWHSTHCNSVLQLPPNVSISEDNNLVIAPQRKEMVKKYEEDGHSLDHLPSGKRKRCALHTGRRTRYYCPVCMIGLCDHSCYSNWHFSDSTVHGPLSSQEASQQCFHYTVSHLTDPPWFVMTCDEVGEVVVLWSHCKLLYLLSMYDWWNIKCCSHFDKRWHSSTKN